MRKKLQVFVVSVIVPLLIVSPVAASIDDMLDSVVAGVYTKHPGLIQSPTQSALSGGSLSFRLNNSPFAAQPLLTLNPPTMALSCNGLDFDAGMLSMMNLDLFGDTLTNAGSQLAWGVMIGLVYSLPGIGEAFGQLQDWARKIQGLMQNPCEMGKQVGASIASKWGTHATERQVAESGDDIAEVYKDTAINIKIKDIATTFPFNALGKANVAADLWPMLTGFFGVMDIYVADHDGNRIVTNATKTFADACGTSGPCSDNNIRIDVKEQPTSLSLDVLMHGDGAGLAKGYSCTLLDDECTGAITEAPINTEGIVKKIASQLRTIVQSYADAGNAPGWTATLGAYSSIVPQTAGMVKYAANIYKYAGGTPPSGGAPSANVLDAERIIGALAENIGEAMIIQMFAQIFSTVYSLSASSINTTQKEELKTYLQNLEKKRDATAKYIAENRSLITSANAMYDRYRHYYDMSATELVRRVGPGAMIFGRK